MTKIDIDQNQIRWNYLSKPFFLQNPRNVLISQEHYCLEADLEMPLIRRLKLSWSSMCMPSNLTNQGTSRTWFPIKSCFGLLVWLLFWSKTDLNLSGLIIILFSENHLIAFWDLAISISTSKVTDFANNDNALSSAKLCTDAFLMQRKKSFKNGLNNTGPAIRPKFGYFPKLKQILTHCGAKKNMKQ